MGSVRDYGKKGYVELCDFATMEKVYGINAKMFANGHVAVHPLVHMCEGDDGELRFSVSKYEFTVTDTISGGALATYLTKSSAYRIARALQALNWTDAKWEQMISDLLEKKHSELATIAYDTIVEAKCSNSKTSK